MKSLTKLVLYVCFLCTIFWSSFAYGDQIFETLYLNTENRLTSAPIADGNYFLGNPDLSLAFSGHLSGGSTMSEGPVYIGIWVAADSETDPTAIFTVTLHKNGALLGSTTAEISPDWYWNYVTVQITLDQSISPSDVIELSISSTGEPGGWRALGVYAQCKIDFPIDETTLVPPEIMSHPERLILMEGEPATFSVKASGLALTYQWQKDSSDIAGETDSSYIIESVTLDDNGTEYRCIVSNSAGSATSEAAGLTVYPTETLYLNTENRLTPYPATDTISYAGYSDLSQTFSGYIYGGKTISGIPVNISLILSAYEEFNPTSAEFGVTLYKNGTPIGSTTAQISEDKYFPAAGYFPGHFYKFVRVQILPAQLINPSDNIGISISSTGDPDDIRELSIDTDIPEYCKIDFPLDPANLLPPEVISQPEHLRMREGMTATFSVRAGGFNVSYQWQKNGSNVAGANGPSYTIESVTQDADASEYRCVVRNSAGSVTSEAATLTVYEEDKIYQSLYLNTANRLTPYPCQSSETYSGLSQAFSGQISGISAFPGHPVYVALLVSAYDETDPTTAVFTVTLNKNGDPIGSAIKKLPEDNLFHVVTYRIVPSQSISPSDSIEILIFSTGGT